MKSADGWIRCSQGHTHWGRVGAAGLLVIHTDADGTARHLLQHRGRIVQKALTWGLPGGALQYGESPMDGALREAAEEMQPELRDIRHRFTFVDDHDGWSYHTVVMDSPTMPELTGNWETGPGGLAWVTVEELEQLDLHPGFAATWPLLEI